MSKLVNTRNVSFNQYTTQKILQESFDTSGYLRQLIYYSDSPSIDAFGRLRVSNPVTIFDSKQIFKDPDLPNNVENFPLFYDNQQISGSGSSTVFNITTASTTLSVSNVTEGTRARQTKMRFNYQPGKSILIFKTFVLGEHVPGVTKRDGLFDEKNGFFLEDNGSTYGFVKRSFISSASVDTRIEQSNWNLDVLDGTGTSGITIDFTKTQISVLDFEWLGVGRVRLGFVINGLIIYVHEFNHANALSTVYTSTPNLPLRCEISNDGTGGSGSVTQICASIISEGGTNDLGVLRYASTNGNHVNADVADTVYAVLGIRLKSNYIGTSIKLIDMSIISETNDDFEWLILLNPTVAGTFTYSNELYSAIQSASGSTSNTVTGGYKISGGFASLDTQSSTKNLENAILLGSTINGTRDEIVLCVRPLSASADIQGSLTWREIS
jgi:hypothetical protein